MFDLLRGQSSIPLYNNRGYQCDSIRCKETLISNRHNK